MESWRKTKAEGYLQLVSEEFVHLGHLRRHTEVYGAVADLDDESASYVGVDLVHLA